MPTTPFLQVDVDRLDRNIRRTAERAAAADVALRPHVKTHKSPEIARRQLAAGATGITVATIGEAEVFAAAGCDDVLVAYPLWLTDHTAERVRRLAGQARLTIGVDSADSAARAADLLAGSGVRLLVEVDSGHHRTGATPRRARATSRPRPGSWRCSARSPSRDTATPPTPVGQQRRTRRQRWPRPRSRSAAPASTRSSSAAAPRRAWPTATSAWLTELRPGVYVFGDAQQWELGAVDPDDVALTCVATVVSHAGGRLVLDSGSKVLGADRAAWATGYGRLLDHPDARLVLLSEHHAVVDLGDVPLPPLGSRVRVVPNHVCNAVNLVDTLWAGTGGVGDAELEAWPVAARGRNG